MSSAASLRQSYVVIEAALSFIGAGIAGILWWQERTAADLPCSTQRGCELDWNSAWSHINLGPWHHVPVALLGFAGYLLLFSFSMLRLASESEKTKRMLHRLTWVVSAGGTGYSWFLQWIAIYKIGHLCSWCLSSATVMSLIFLVTTFEYLAVRRSLTLPSAAGEHIPHV